MMISKRNLLFQWLILRWDFRAKKGKCEQHLHLSGFKTSPLKMDAWKMMVSFPFWDDSKFKGYVQHRKERAEELGVAWYLRSLHNMQRSGATPRFRSAHLFRTPIFRFDVSYNTKMTEACLIGIFRLTENPLP